MKIKIDPIIVLGFVFLVLIFSGCDQNKNRSVVPDNYPDVFNDLLGTWNYIEQSTFETWEIQYNILVASVYKISKYDTVLLETVNIAEEANEIYYVVTVYNQNEGKPVKFKLIEAESSSLLFENKDHDFPQKIKYKLIDKNNLEVVISGTINNELKEIPFQYSRVTSEFSVQ